jgi:hypothetical protein
MSTSEKLQILAEVVIIGLLLYLAFLKSYFQEKGKNLATKEDIKEMTSLVESVKSELQYSLQAKLSLRAEEHDALIDYFTKLSAWLSAISNCSFAGVDKDNLGRLSEIRTGLDTYYVEVGLAASKMELLTESAEIPIQHGELMIEALKFAQHTSQVTFDFEKIYLDAKHLTEGELSKERVSQYSALLDQVREIHKKYREEQLQMYQALYPLLQRHRLTVSNHLRSIAQNQ